MPTVAWAPQPAVPAAVEALAASAVPSALGVLAGRAEAAAAGAAIGLAAAAASGARCALVCRWTSEAPDDGPPASAPAVGAARRLCARLTARGLTAIARGRLVTVLLPAADLLARAAAERAMAVAGDVPTVLVLAGPRSPTFDPLLAELDRLVVVPPPGAPTGLEHLAIESAAAIGRRISVLRLPPSSTPTHRLTVSCGRLFSPSLRAAATAALKGNHHA